VLPHRSKGSVGVFLFPALVVYAFVVVAPILQSLALSFFRWDGITDHRFVGLDNYARMLFRDPVFWEAAWHSLVYVAVNLAFTLGVALLVANLLLRLRRGREVIKTLYLLPAVISTVAIALLFQRVYSFDPPGLLNRLIQVVGLPGVPWLSDPNAVLLAVSVPEGWRFVGLYMLIFYAALLAVPAELEEAARLDGAGEWQIFTSVRFPYIRPVFITTAVMAATYSLRGFDIPYLLTGGGPGQASELLTTLMYKTAFTSTNFGYASAIAVAIVVQCVVAVALIFALLRPRGGDR